MQCYMLRVVSLGNNIQRSQTMERLQDENHRGYYLIKHTVQICCCSSLWTLRIPARKSTLDNKPAWLVFPLLCTPISLNMSGTFQFSWHHQIFYASNTVTLHGQLLKGSCNLRLHMQRATCLRSFCCHSDTTHLLAPTTCIFFLLTHAEDTNWQTMESDYDNNNNVLNRHLMG